MPSTYVDLVASTAQTVVVSNGDPVLDEVADAPDRYLIPAADVMEVVNVDGDDIVYFNVGFAAGFNAASAGALPAAPTVGNADYVVPAEPGEWLRVRVPREHNIAVVRAISAGTPRIGVSLLTRGGTRGDDPMGPGGSHDYTPYVLDANASDPDTVILGLSPFAYYVGDDASGNPQDSSGNGRHAVSTVATISYSQAALTSKVGASIAITAGGKIQFPTPAGALMRDLGSGTPNEWTITGLVMFTARDGGDGGTERAWLSQLGATGINWVMAFPQSGNGTVDLSNMLVGAIWRMGGDPAIPLDVPLVFAVVREGGQVGIWGRDVVKWYVNGVLFGQCAIGDTSNTSENFFLGRPSDEFWGAPNLRWSNLATFATALTPAQIVTVAEALMGSSDLSAAWTP